MTNRAPTQQQPDAADLDAKSDFPFPEQPGLDAAPVQLVGPIDIQTHTTLDLIAHVQTDQGIAIDIIVRNAKHDTPEGDAQRALTFGKALIAKGLKPIPPPAAPVINMPAPAAAAGPAAAAATPAQLEYKGEVFEECPECGGEVFDNRAKKKSGEMAAGAPFFACKDRDNCGWKKWPPRPAGSRGGGNRRPANR